MIDVGNLSTGDIVGRDYRIESPLSAGGMGAVYVAEQLSTGKRRALKVMRPELVTDARSRRRFVDEAKAGARIESEHVVEVIGAGVDEVSGVPWLAMELLRGEDLDAHIRQHGPMPLAEVIDVLDQVAHALGQAHALGIIHRDLKPENLFRTVSKRRGAPPVIKVLDFGIASFVSSNKTAATVTSAIGSPFWIAPEQTNTGAKLKPGTDVWALGLIAFYLLTGKSYWPAANAEDFQLNALLAEILAHPLVPASQRAHELGSTAEVPPAFDAWFASCVNRDMEARPADAHVALQPLLAMSDEPAPLSAPSASGVAPTMALPEAAATAVAPISAAGVSSVPGTMPLPVAKSERPVPGAPSASGTMMALGAAAVVILGLGGVWAWSSDDPESAASDDATPSEVSQDEANPVETELPDSVDGLEWHDVAEPASSEPVPASPLPAIPAPPDVAAPPANATRTASGLAYRVLTRGTGTTHPGPTDRVTVHYSGWTTDGQLFDSSRRRGEPLTMTLGSTIPGWSEGVQLMVVGETTRMWIPEELAYQGRSGAPAGMLVFDTELLAFEAAAPPPETPPNLTAPPRSAERTDSGLASLVIEPGTGRSHPAEDDTVRFHLDGWTSDGELFDSTTERAVPLTVPLVRLAIPGLREGIQLMVAGEKRRFWVPQELAFNGHPGAPEGALVFDIRLLAILN